MLKMAASSVTSIVTISISAITCAVQIALAIIQTRFAISVLPNTNIYGLALVASVLDIISVPVLAAGIVFRLRHLHRQITLPFHIVSASVLVTASILTIYCFVWTNDHFRSRVGKDNQTLVDVGITMASIDLATLAVFYVLLLWWDQPEMETSRLEIGPQRSMQTQTTKSLVGTSLASLSSTPFFTQSIGSSMTSTTTPRRSQSSVRYSIIPSSKTNPSLRGSYASSDGGSVPAQIPASVVIAREQDGFADWVTATEEALTSHESLGGKSGKNSKIEPTRLATIAGSRPGSPETTPHKVTARSIQAVEYGTSRQSAQALPLAVPADLPASLHLNTLPTLRTSKSDSSLRFHRAPRSTKPKSNIHPLFRSESAGPLPIASPGTVITASPLAGQVIRQEGGRRSLSIRNNRSTHGLFQL